MVVEPVAVGDEGRYQRLMAAHHHLGALPKIGETLWYAAIWRGDRVALAGFSAAALKCAARDRWIGRDLRTQYDRQHLLANNSRFLVLPGGRVPNLGSRACASRRGTGRDASAIRCCWRRSSIRRPPGRRREGTRRGQSEALSAITVVPGSEAVGSVVRDARMEVWPGPGRRAVPR